MNFHLKVSQPPHHLAAHPPQPQLVPPVVMIILHQTLPRVLTPVVVFYLQKAKQVLVVLTSIPCSCAVDHLQPHLSCYVFMEYME